MAPPSLSKGQQLLLQRLTAQPATLSNQDALTKVYLKLKKEYEMGKSLEECLGQLNANLLEAGFEIKCLVTGGGGR